MAFFDFVEAWYNPYQRQWPLDYASRIECERKIDGHESGWRRSE